MGCSSIGYFFLGLFLLIWLINEPSGWFFVLFVVLVVGVIIFATQKARQSKSNGELVAAAVLLSIEEEQEAVGFWLDNTVF